MDGQAFAARPFLEEFARLGRERGDFGWHVAFHPYPENLFEPRFWNDRTATDIDDTPNEEDAFAFALPIVGLDSWPTATTEGQP
jgi:hypothetical protein